MVVVDDARDLPEIIAALVAAAAGPLPGAATVRLDLDLDAPAPKGAVPVTVSASRPTTAFDLPPADRSELLLVGPGVVRAGGVEAMQALAAARGAGVSNTWGAKGVFVWESPYHFGTVGLQEGDLRLGGFGDVARLLVLGADEDEWPWEQWGEPLRRAGVDVVEIPLTALDPLRLGPTAPPVGAKPPLFDALATVCRPLYASTAYPAPPPRVIADIAAALDPLTSDLVVADPATPAGLWMARAFPTAVLGSVVVPATGGPGFAIAAGLAASRLDRRAVAVTGPAPDPALLDAVRMLLPSHARLVISAWCSPGAAPPGDHAAALRAALSGPSGVHVIPVAVDFSCTDALVEVAGPVTAWQGRCAF